MSFIWTKYSPLENETSLQDPLAFDYYAQTLANEILPSLTTRTSRARYYCVVCYGIYIASKHLENTNTQISEESIKDTFALFEKYWARSVAGWYIRSGGGIAERDGKENGFRGKRGAVSAAQNENLTTLGEKYKLLTRQLELGGFGSYRSSLENLELVDPYLHLTHRGQQLAKSFVNTHFDCLVLRALKEQRIVDKEGRATINTFGESSRLDAFAEKEFNPEERRYLREMIMDHASVTTTAALIKTYYGNDKTLDMVKRIAQHAPASSEEERIVRGYQTIEAFEIFCIHVNKIWSALIEAAMEKMNVITATEATSACEVLIDQLYDTDLIGNLLRSPSYIHIINSFHGTSLDTFLRQHTTVEQHRTLVLDLIRMHIEIMKRRHSGSWVQLDGTSILILTGFDFPQKTKNGQFLHDYKTSNVTSLIKDTGWREDV